MSVSDQTTSPTPAPPSGPLCPYCGAYPSKAKECSACRGVFEPLSRQASQNAMGPWFVRDEQNPFRPGCSYATLRFLTLKGRITPDTVIRGPSTRQFWTLARNTPGVAHILGECHACRARAGIKQKECGRCGASFEVPDDRQYLGLAEVRMLPGQHSAQEIAQAARKAAPVGVAADTTESWAHGSPAAAIETGEDFNPVPLAPEPAAPRAIAHEESAASSAPDQHFDRRDYQQDFRRDWPEREPPAARHRTMLMILLAVTGAGAIMVLVMWFLSVSAQVSGKGTQNAPLQAGVPMNTAPPPIAPGPTPNPPQKQP